MGGGLVEAVVFGALATPPGRDRFAENVVP